MKKDLGKFTFVLPAYYSADLRCSRCRDPPSKRYHRHLSTTYYALC